MKDWAKVFALWIAVVAVWPHVYSQQWWECESSQLASDAWGLEGIRDILGPRPDCDVAPTRTEGI